MAKAGLKRRPKPAAAAQAKKKVFKWNPEQQKVIDFLLSKEGQKVRELLLASGSRCFLAGTPVATPEGYIPIEHIKEGDTVLSVDESTGELQGQQVLKTFRNDAGQSRKIITFVMEDGTKIRCTQQHELHQKGSRTSAGEIARRALERYTWDKREVSGEQPREVTDAGLEGNGRNARNEAGARCERVSSDNDKTVWTRKDGEGPSSDSRDVDRNPGERSRPDKPHKQYPGRQQGRKSGVGQQERESFVDDVAGKADHEPRFKERHEQADGADRGESSGDTKEIRCFRYDTETVGGRVRYWPVGVSGHSVRTDLEAREVDIADIAEIHIGREYVETYDICVATNHNYLVTENNYLVANSGKTYLIITMMVTTALKYPGSRQLIARKFFSHVKNSIFADTLPKVISDLFSEVKPFLYWNNTDYFVQFPNGSEIWLAGLDDKERVDKILGREYLNILFNEASEIDYETYLTVKTRLAQLVDGATNRIFIDLNPTSSRHWCKKLFVDKMDPVKNIRVASPERYAYMTIHPMANKDNVSKDYLEMLRNMPENQKRRFFDGLFRDDAQFALWKSETINRNRVTEQKMPPLKRIVVAVDPAVSAKETSDETGIVVVGLGFNGHLYTLADYTGTYRAEDWAAKVVEAYNYWRADMVVAEVNNGGDLVETVLRTTPGGRLLPYEGVHATRNKFTRAEPVAALMEQGLDHHVGELVKLEEEMTTWEGKKGEDSPNRIDAKVWGAFSLLPEMGGYRPQMGGNFVGAMRMQGFG